MSKKIDKNNIKGKKRKKCLRDKTAPRPPHSGKQYLNYFLSKMLILMFHLQDIYDF